MFEDLEQTVKNSLNQKGYSPYQLARLESELRGKAVPAQKLYNYVHKGYIKAVKTEAGWVINQEDAYQHLMKIMVKDSIRRI